MYQTEKVLAEESKEMRAVFAEVMEELAIGKNTLYRLLNSGELPAFRIGKLWRVRRGRFGELEPNLQSLCP